MFCVRMSGGRVWGGGEDEDEDEEEGEQSK